MTSQHKSIVKAYRRFFGQVSGDLQSFATAPPFLKFPFGSFTFEGSGTQSQLKKMRCVFLKAEHSNDVRKRTEKTSYITASSETLREYPNLFLSLLVYVAYEMDAIPIVFVEASVLVAWSLQRR